MWWELRYCRTPRPDLAAWASQMVAGRVRWQHEPLHCARTGHHSPITPHPHAQTVVHYTPNTPCHPHSTEVACTLSKHSGGLRPQTPPRARDAGPSEQPRGGFATIDPRHAGDTPQSSAYGSNSPQATNKHKPHHHDKQTKTCRTRPTLPPKEHAALALPSNHGGFCDHRPPTRRRHAATQRLW